MRSPNAGGGAFEAYPTMAARSHECLGAFLSNVCKFVLLYLKALSRHGRYGFASP